MNKIIFFTSHFPYRTVGENFFESELWEIAPHYDEVYIIACESRQKFPEIKKNLPPNVTPVCIKRSSFLKELLLGILLCPFCPFFWKEIANIRKGYHPFLPSLKSTFYACFSFLAIRKGLSKVAKQITISSDDHVVLVGYWLHFLSKAALSFKKLISCRDIKVVARAHGSADIQNFAKPQRYYPFQADLLDRLDAVFAVSKSGCEYLRARSARPETVNCIYIGSAGPETFTPRSRAPFTVMSCSNIIPLKRVGLVAEAVRILSRTIPDIQWIHFGDGLERQALETACADIASHVDFRGYTEHHAVLCYLASGKASVFVSASATEGLPISVIEAIAHSLPVIATDVGSTGEAVVNETSGVLLPSDITAKELAKQISAFYYMNDSEYNDMSKKAFMLWQQKFDSRKNANCLLSALEQN